MAVQGSSGLRAEVDGAAFRALRVVTRPAEFGVLGVYGLTGDSFNSGTVMDAGLAAGVGVVIFEWLPKITGLRAITFAAVHRVGFHMEAVTAASAAALASFEIVVMRTKGFQLFNNIGPLFIDPNNIWKFRTSMSESLVTDRENGIFGSDGTAELGNSEGPGYAWTTPPTFDAQGFGNLTFGIGTAATSAQTRRNVTPPGSLIFDGRNHPLILATSEGWMIRVGPTALPAGMTWRPRYHYVWSEILGY